MKAEELRLGNLLNFKGFEWKVDQIPDDPNYFEKHEPIPLTEEWLFRFGFGKIQHVYNRHSKLLLEPHSNGGFLVKTWGKMDAHAKSFNHELIIKYVHQLQNLYFALTGDELTLK